MKKLIIPLVFIMFSLISSAETVVGIVTNQNNEPIPATIIRQIHNHNNTVVSNLNGEFAIDLIECKEIILSFSNLGYLTRTIKLSTEEVKDTIKVILQNGDEAKIESESISRKLRLTSIFTNLGYNSRGVNFKRFTEFTDKQIDILNKNKHYCYFGLASYIKNFYTEISYGMSPLYKEVGEHYRHMSNGTTLTFNTGYGFGFTQNNRYILTPYIGVNRLCITETVAPLSTVITLEDYLKQGYMNIKITQYTGNVGCDFMMKLVNFGRFNRRSLNISAGAAYTFKLHSTPYIYSTATKITTDSKLSVFPIYAKVGLVYMIDFSRKSSGK